MLFQLDDSFENITPLPYHDMASLEKREKHLENLLARHLFENLFEDKRLLPFHQERSLQSEADIYALNEDGDVVIFELKAGGAGSSALHQLLRYAEDAGQWTYQEIERKLQKYPGNTLSSDALKIAHQEAFGLENCLKEEEFNRHQHMMVVGNAADEELIQSVGYWRNKGLSIDISTYRIYSISGSRYFEFYAKPYDCHANPGNAKGVLFDTCCTRWGDKPLEPLETMIRDKKISAWGDSRYAVNSLSRGDPFSTIIVVWV